MIMPSLFSIYAPSYPTVLAYMMQSTEYEPKAYLSWLWRTKDFRHSALMKRRTLNRTKMANQIVFSLRLGMLAEIIGGLVLIYLGLFNNLAGGIELGIAALIAYPIVWSHLAVLILLAKRLAVNGPAARSAISDSERTFAGHKGVKIAVAGSYGKTTMKELLLTVLSEGKKVAATPANKNVSISHAHFAQKLDGDEDILIIEYGEGAPGDVARFARLTHPTHGVITGLAPAHLDQYKTLQAAGDDIFGLADYLENKQVYVNDQPSAIKPYLKPAYHVFNNRHALGWNIEQVEVSLTGTSFSLKKGKSSLNLSSGLIGRHQVGFLAFVAAFALEQGLSQKQVTTGIARTAPFEHRMQPYQLAGAWVIDDTYNGNLEGFRAGISLLADLEAKRKIYVTPGLVDQGEETERVHVEIGKLIAVTSPNLVVLMQNSTTEYISQGLKAGKYKGEVQIENNPLDFYTNLNHFVASGDLVLMQNDWTDNYA